MESVPFDAIVIVEGEAYVSQLGATCTWVKVGDKVAAVAKTKERMMGAMLLHEERNTKYRQAIRTYVRPGDVVLDAGSGTGLLALLAAEAGASLVWASEMNEVFASLSQQVVDLSAFSEVIECVSIRTSQMELADDDKVDLIVTETMDSVLCTEGLIATIRDAKKRLGKPGCKVIPQRAQIFGRLVQLTGDMLDVYNAKPTQPMLLLHADCPRVASCMISVSDDQVLFDLDFEEDNLEDLFQDVSFTPSDSQGIPPHALLCWWQAQLAPGVFLSSLGGEWQDHWMHSLYLLKDDSFRVGLKLDVESGEMSIVGDEAKRIRVEHSSYRASLWKEPLARVLSGETTIHYFDLNSQEFGGNILVWRDEDGKMNEIDAALCLLYRMSASPSSPSQIVPRTASVRCASLSFAQLKNPRLYLDSVCGFSHEPVMRAWKTEVLDGDPTFPLSLFNYEFSMTSEAITVAKMDFALGEIRFSESNAVLSVGPVGANALVFWVEWELVEGEYVAASNPNRLHPLATNQVMFLGEPRAGEAELRVGVRLDSTTNRLVFRAD